MRVACPVCGGTGSKPTFGGLNTNAASGMPCPACFGTGIQDDDPQPQKFSGGIAFPDHRITALEAERDALESKLKALVAAAEGVLFGEPVRRISSARASRWAALRDAIEAARREGGGV